MKRSIAIAALAAALTLSSGALALGGITGTYSATIKTAPAAQLKGIWKLKFTAAGAYTIFQNGTAIVFGKVRFEQGSATVKDTGGPAACKPEGTYRYFLALRGKSLAFSPLRDSCSARKFVLTRKFTKTG
jgi:hypothetical protein